MFAIFNKSKGNKLENRDWKEIKLQIKTTEVYHVNFIANTIGVKSCWFSNDYLGVSICAKKKKLYPLACLNF